MIRTFPLVTASALALGLTLGPVQAQESPVQDSRTTAEALIVAQLQIEGSADGATAAEVAARVVDALTAQGYRVVEVSQTFLGRLRVVAESAEDRREVIVSRTTGAVLRDRITATFGASGQTSGQAAGAGAAGAGVSGGTTSGGLTGGLSGGLGVGADGSLGVGGSGGSAGAGAEGSIGGSASVGLGG